MPAFGVDDTLHPGRSIKSGEYIKSKWSKGYLVLTKEGNLAVYDSMMFKTENRIWQSNTPCSHDAPFRLEMQTDGNLVVYNRHNKPTWSSNTWQTGHHLCVQDDFNVVVYNAHNQPVWATNTGRS